MDHPGLVGGLQRLGNLLRNRQRFIDGDRALGDPVGERRPLDEFEHQCPSVISLFDAVDLRDVGVVEAGEDLRFPLEPGKAIRVLGEGVGEDLQRHLAVELGVSRLPDLAHATLAEQSGDVVMSDAGVDGQGHGG